ncbi:MAG TPA: cytochrome c, partial [Vicinamibacteria bacterium]|nr:cytochrome c [Vicinamibacteria bacterium]
MTPARARAGTALAFSVALAACEGAPPPVREPKTPAPAVAQPVTFNRDIAPIVFQNCIPCHRPGEAGPFSLLSYADVHKRAQQIARVTSIRYMPPWPPEPGYGDLAGARRLDDAQIALLQRWATEGAVEGPPAKAPPLPAFTQGWQLGPPDLVLEVP